MKILVTGSKGMLGRTLARTLPCEGFYGADLPETDILDTASLQRAFDAFRPDAVVHCAAYTNVDRCESDPEGAFRLNRDGSANVARACARHSARLVAISTDYVFSGTPGAPRDEADPPGPATVYGKSKLAGEQAVQAELPDAAIVRTAWLYGPGGPSFVHTMAKLGAAEGAPLKVVDDQRGNPTSTAALSKAIAFVLENGMRGIVHGTCEGVCTWYGFACEIFRLLGLKRGVQPCTTAEFPRPAPRPADSALAKNALAARGFRMPDWRDALKEFLKDEFPRV